MLSQRQAHFNAHCQRSMGSRGWSVRFLWLRASPPACQALADKTCTVLASKRRPSAPGAAFVLLARAVRQLRVPGRPRAWRPLAVRPVGPGGVRPSAGCRNAPNGREKGCGRSWAGGLCVCQTPDGTQLGTCRAGQVAGSPRTCYCCWYRHFGGKRKFF